MGNETKLLINADLVDARSLNEEYYRAYESVTVNTVMIVVTEESRQALARLPLKLNADEMIEIPLGRPLMFREVNGSCEISGDTVLEADTMMVVNGEAVILNGAEKALSQIIKMVVNGKIVYPESMGGFLSRTTVNGVAVSYPDGAVLLKRSFLMDEYFPLRAQQGRLYYAEDEIIIGNERIDAERLLEKKVRFCTKKVLITEKLVEKMASLFNERAEFIVIPAGFTLFTEDVLLTPELVKKADGKIYVMGNVRFGEEFEKSIERIEKLIVRGTVYLKRKQKEKFEKLHAEADCIAEEKREVHDMLRAVVDTDILKGGGSVRYSDIASVKLTEEITPEMILNQLSFSDVAEIICTEEQRSAVTAVSEDVAFIRTQSELKENLKDFLGGLFGKERDGEGKAGKNTKVINADKYIM